MLDLFTGIGGFSLAASWVWGNELDLAGFCEQDVYCGKVLKKNFPDVPIYPDIKELRGEWFQDIDLITGGFPCQDISVAGKGAGIDGDRSGLWSELCRVISEVRPRYALIENVPMLIHRGLERVLCDLTEIGYDAEWQVIGADDVGARHKRKRIWIVAYPGHLRGRHDECGDVGLRSGKQAETAIGNASQFEVAGPGKEPKTMAHTDDAGSGASADGQRNEVLAYSGDSTDPSKRGPSSKTNSISEKYWKKRCSGVLERTSGDQKVSSFIPDTNTARLQGSEETGNFESQRTQRHQFVTGSCATGDIWTVEPDVGRVANGVPKRVDRLRGVGNAIVPQIAALIMQMIKDDMNL